MRAEKLAPVLESAAGPFLASLDPVLAVSGQGAALIDAGQSAKRDHAIVDNGRLPVHRPEDNRKRSPGRVQVKIGGALFTGKICTKCKKPRALCLFYPDPQNSDGRSSWCMRCRKRSSRARRRAGLI